MGVPKFYRWISERYPCLSEVVKEFQLPEFDNLYLDMNGIIHVCSHPDDENPHFRMSEEQMFKDICHYIDFLFRMIKPRRVFYMAVDGVAPRAKMNQQRGRRFRSAREAETLIEQAKAKGEVLPTEKRFDSNCITPGTPFMVRLQEHLQYFVVDKITNDPLWQGPKVFLSGHETPGEGEHKVMDYIRYARSQPGYDPDTRHCLYGLDADLIMLGLTSHEPHFSLLREEVRFGGRKDKNKRPSTPEETTFHLLHLSLLRDYLAYEFKPLEGKLNFPWDMERLIDDWILMGFLVGNDFIPHLPHLHIHHDALPLLWRTYMQVLPTLDGYLNENGHLNLKRFEKYLDALAKFDNDTFQSGFSDFKALEQELGGKAVNESLQGGAGAVKPIVKDLQPFEMEESDVVFECIEDSPALKGNQFAALASGGSDLPDLVGDALGGQGSGSTSEGSDCCDETEVAYANDGEDLITAEFRLHKREYYMTKMGYKKVTPAVLQEQAEGYVRALQWILLYYFKGCPSWSWFYPHHYAPYISDVRNIADLNIEFDLATPFLPFQQLMAVLPAASKDLLPPALQPLMTEVTSPVLDFYPVNFNTDLNGKQQDWEAVVLIPFIQEDRLLAAMSAKESLLTPAEKARNTHGPHMVYHHSPDAQGPVPSPRPGVLPDIPLSRAKLERVHKDLYRCVPDLIQGLLPEVRLEVYFPGFPTLRFLKHTHELKKVGVRVFQQASRNENMLLKVEAEPDVALESVAEAILGSCTHVGWPHIHQAKVIGVANHTHRIELVEDFKKGVGLPPAQSFRRRTLTDEEKAVVHREASTIKEKHLERFGISVGNTEILVYACPVTGRNYTFGNTGLITLEKQYSNTPVNYAYQMTIKDLDVEEAAHTTFKTLDEVFPDGCTIFMLGLPHYGAQGIVRETLTSAARVRISLSVKQEPDFQALAQGKGGGLPKYLPPHVASQMIGVNAHLLSRVTGSVFVTKAGDKGQRVNVGLNLKFTKRREEVPGYTAFQQTYGWGYTKACVNEVQAYLARFKQMWTNIEANTKGTDMYAENDVIDDKCSFTLQDVQEYLGSVACAKAARMKFGAHILGEPEIARIEAAVDDLNKNADIVKIKVKPRLLFRSLPGQGTLVPDPETDFRLYDRVVVVKAGFSVPFGHRGTVVGIPSPEEEAPHPHRLLDVVFDRPFPGGITLRCSAHRGYRVPASAMLNITYGEFRKSSDPADKGDYWAKQSGPGGNASNNSLSGGQHGRPNTEPRASQGAGAPVAWDNRRQPMFGKVFGANGQMYSSSKRPPLLSKVLK